MSRYNYSRNSSEWLQFLLAWVIACVGSAFALSLVGLTCKLAYQCFMFGWGLV